MSEYDETDAWVAAVERELAGAKNDDIARAIGEANLWAGAWNKMSEPERNVHRYAATCAIAAWNTRTNPALAAAQAEIARLREALEARDDSLSAMTDEIEHLVQAVAARASGKRPDIEGLYDYVAANYPDAWHHSGGPARAALAPRP